MLIWDERDGEGRAGHRVKVRDPLWRGIKGAGIPILGPTVAGAGGDVEPKDDIPLALVVRGAGGVKDGQVGSVVAELAGCRHGDGRLISRQGVRLVTHGDRVLECAGHPACDSDTSLGKR